MEPWDPDKIAQVIALIATGFATRWAYTTQFPPKDEEHTITIVWAAIWSGVIATIVQLVHRPLPDWIVQQLPKDGPGKAAAHTAHIAATNAAALMLNMVTFMVVGFIVGRIRVANEAVWRERKMAVDQSFDASWNRFFTTLFSLEHGFSSACQYFLKNLADGQWITVETEKGVYLGFVKVHDAREEDNFYLVLHEACSFDDVKQKFPSEMQWPAIMFRSDQVKSVALYLEKDTEMPETTEARSLNEPTDATEKQVKPT